MDDYISASEINKFFYCQRAWWYRLQGVESAYQTRLEEGITQHQQIGHQLQSTERLKRFAWWLLAAGLILLLLLIFTQVMRGG